MAPVIRALNARPDDFEQLVVTTGQHREMLGQMLDAFEFDGVIGWGGQGELFAGGTDGVFRHGRPFR